MSPRFSASATSFSIKSMSGGVSGRPPRVSTKPREQRDDGGLDAEKSRAEPDAARADGRERVELARDEAALRTHHERARCARIARAELGRAGMRDPDRCAARERRQVALGELAEAAREPDLGEHAVAGLLEP